MTREENQNYVDVPAWMKMWKITQPKTYKHIPANRLQNPQWQKKYAQMLLDVVQDVPSGIYKQLLILMMKHAQISRKELIIKFKEIGFGEKEED